MMENLAHHVSGGAVDSGHELGPLRVLARNDVRGDEVLQEGGPVVAAGGLARATPAAGEQVANNSLALAQSPLGPAPLRDGPCDRGLAARPPADLGGSGAKALRIMESPPHRAEGLKHVEAIEQSIRMEVF